LYELEGTEVITEYFDAGVRELHELTKSIRELPHRCTRRVQLRSGESRVIVSEVFFDRQRIDFYRRLPADVLRDVFFIVHDLLPLTDPQFFPPNIPFELICGYYQLLLDAPNTGFNSRATRAAFFDRLARRSHHDGAVLHLGSDSLPQPGKLPVRDSFNFCVVGTVEPRKKHVRIAQAFEHIFQQDSRVSLSFVGRKGWIGASDEAYLRELLHRYSGRFRWIEEADDAAVSEHIVNSRAPIFLSAAEGFGLPPVESLYLGVPVISSRKMPSLEDVTQGVRFTDPDKPEEIAKVVRELCDQSHYERLIVEVKSLKLPTWASFAARVHDWVSSGVSSDVHLTAGAGAAFRSSPVSLREVVA
jgi:glycosyltransferase involved in cell wall biosynthesis